MDSEIKISQLEPDDKDSILKIAQWYFDEWDTEIDKTARRLSNQPNEGLLFQLVLTKDKEVIATGGLGYEVNLTKKHKKFTKLGPWLTLLYTEKSSRNQGLGQMVLEQIEILARQRMLKKIYLYTFTAESLYTKCGWVTIDRVNYKDQDTAIMEKQF